MRRPRSGFASLLFTALVAVESFAVTKPLQAQVKSDRYLMQVAAVVNDYSGGRMVWVVMCGTTDPYEVQGAYSSEVDARAAINLAATQQKRCNLEGPYHPNETYASDTLLYGTVCKKLYDSSCQSDTSRAYVFAAAEINQVAITYTLRNGSVVSDTFSPQKVEAVFFTMSAADRLLRPYYARRLGPDSARVLRHRWACRMHATRIAPRSTCPTS